MLTAKSFQINVVSSATDTTPQIVSMTLWAVDSSLPAAQPIRLDINIDPNDPVAADLIAAFTSHLASIKQANGVS